MTRRFEWEMWEMKNREVRRTQLQMEMRFSQKQSNKYAKADMSEEASEVTSEGQEGAVL